MIKALFVSLISFALTAAPALAAQPPQPQNEFVPIDRLPPSDQLPSAPLLVGAYAFVWVAVMFYLWTVWRRLQKVEADMHALERRARSETR